MEIECMEQMKTVIAKDAIRSKLYTYCRGMDRIDNDLAYTAFTEDSQVDYGPHFTGTGREFVDWVSKTHEKVYLATTHQITNIIIEVHGDTACSEAYLHTLQLTRPNDKGKSQELHVAARYLDEWVLRDEDWKIQRRRYIQDIAEVRNCEYDGGRFGAARDKTDPSYEILGK